MDAPVNQVSMARIRGKPRARKAKSPEAASEPVLKLDPDAPEAPIIPKRNTKRVVLGAEGGLPIPSVDYKTIKETTDPLAVRDQLMRDYFAARAYTDEVIQKMCALVFKHHS